MASASGLARIAGGDPCEIFSRAELGDADALAKLSLWCREIVHLLSLVVGFINPSTVIIGGAVSAQGGTLLKYIEKELWRMPEPYRNTFTLKTAKDEGFSGAFGAVKYALEMEK